jgi:putative transposase
MPTTSVRRRISLFKRSWVLVGAVLAEQHDEWAESRRYLGLDILSKSRADQSSPTEQEATPAALTA